MTAPAGPSRRGRTRRALRWVARILALYLVAGYVSANVRLLPQAPAASTGPAGAFTSAGSVVTGVFSVHTDNSHDAWGSLDDVGRAARMAGLDFVVLGDHPADPRRPDWTLHPPSFREQVLVVQGQELVARGVGRVLGLGLDTTFHRWNEGPDSLSDFFQRAGGSIFVVHGRSPRATERWRVGLLEGLDGWEVLDMSETVQDRLVGPWMGYHLATFLVALPMGRGDAALLHLASRDGFDVPSVQAWDSLRSSSHLAAIAGLNHHSQLEVRGFLIPPFEPFFRTLLNHVELGGPLSQDPATAEDQLVRAAVAGHVWVSLGRGEEAGAFRFGAYRGSELTARMGETAAMDGATVLRAGFPTRDGLRVAYRVVRDGETVAWMDGPELEWSPPGPGRYRVEVYRYAGLWRRWALRWRPWILTNPVTLTTPGPENGIEQR